MQRDNSEHNYNLFVRALDEISRERETDRQNVLLESIESFLEDYENMSHELELEANEDLVDLYCELKCISRECLERDWADTVNTVLGKRNQRC